MGRGGSDVTAVIARHLRSYVERAIGDDAVHDVCAAAGVDPDDPRFGDGQRWFGADEVAALFDAASVVTGDPDLGFRIGEELFRRDEAIGNGEFLRATGGPHAAFDSIAEHTGLLVTVRRFDVVDRGDTHVAVACTPQVDRARHRYLCRLAAGYWTQVPGVFGGRGTVVETRCASRGADACCLVVRWDRQVSASDAERERSQRRADALIGRFEDMQRMAAELAATDDLAEASHRIIERASSAMLTSRFVLTVREHEHRVHEVFSSDMSPADAEAVAGRLWRGEQLRPGELGRPAVADVASGERHFGYLAAFLPVQGRVRAIDERLLGAYARHAAATIERVIAMAGARREHRTAESLLELSHSLAAARSIPDVTERVTTAVGQITGCDISGVWLLDAPAGCYRLQTVRDRVGLAGPRSFPAPSDEGIAAMAANPQPFVMDRASAPPQLGDVFDGWGVDVVQVAPIAHRGRLYGLLATGTTTGTLAGEELEAVLAAISALAHQAGTAIANTTLLEQIRHQAQHDALTGLPNRPQIEERARVALRDAARDQRAVGVAFVDLDRFKNVNDTLGHVAGDDLIGSVAQRLAANVRPTDVVARLGGDEFLLLLPDLDGPEQAEEVAERVLDAIRAPIQLRGEPLFVSASVGIACFPHHGRDYGTLLARADAAMYAAKARGRNRYAVHEAAGTDDRSALKTESELHRAIARDELRLHFQPQVDLITADIVAAEALVRWQHPTMGLIGPGSFLAVAEESGLIVDLDRWVRRQAFTQAAEWARQGTPVRVSVNVSRRDLADADLVADIASLLDRLDLDPTLIEMEITDRIVMSDEDLPPSVERLRELGVRLAVDDFGTGSSVLSRLQHCDFDVLKVDRTFVEPLARPQPDTRLIDGLVSLAHAFGMEVVVEGVEDEQQANAARLLGAELVQGFYFHRGMPADDLTALLVQQAEGGPVTAAPPTVLPFRGRRSRRDRQ